MRWKTQLNENAKVPAFWNSQPELSHNEVCGWGQHGDITRQVLTLVNLRHDGEHPQVSRRFETGTVLAMGPSLNRTGPDRNTSLNVSLEQPLVRGWDSEITRDPVRRAEFSLASSQRALEQARNNVAIEAIGAYYNVLREQQLFAFALAQRDRIEQHTAVAGSKERSGLIGPMDLLRARIRLKDAEDSLNQARVTVQSAMNRLRRALDIPLDTALALGPPGPPRVDGDDLEAEAVARRFEILQLRAELDEAVRAAGVAQKNVFPEVTLHVAAGQATLVDPFLVQYVPTTQRQWSVFLQSTTDLTRTAEKNAARQAMLVNLQPTFHTDWRGLGPRAEAGQKHDERDTANQRSPMRCSVATSRSRC